VNLGTSCTASLSKLTSSPFYKIQTPHAGYCRGTASPIGAVRRLDFVIRAGSIEFIIINNVYADQPQQSGTNVSDLHQKAGSLYPICYSKAAPAVSLAG
jgi:hypothetical protein